MRRRYGWYLPISPDELQAIWASATVSVDANVLLDLYRHHEEVRDRILAALRHFKGRLWLTNQAAEEFIRNRTSVITRTAAEYEAARNAIKGLEEALAKARDTLRGQRFVLDSVPENLERHTLAATRDATAAVDEAKSSRPNFLKEDPILEAVFDLFDGAVGDAPSADERVQLGREAKRRQDEKIPPGYMDAQKDGQRADGDYLLWHEVLLRAKDTQRDLILVTSERKEDWWEIQSGRKLGPRRELLEEAHAVSGQRVLILATELFVERAAEQEGQKLPQDLLFEIRHVSEQRGNADDRRGELDEIIQAAVEALAIVLPNEEPICSLIAETNATGYYADDVEITAIGDLDLESAEIDFEASVHFCGDQDGDKMWYGDAIQATVKGSVGFDGDDWVVRHGYEVSGHIERDEDERDDDE
jgi:hypothetical protein